MHGVLFAIHIDKSFRWPKYFLNVQQRLLSDVTPSSAPLEDSRQLIDLFVNAFMNISTICRYIYGQIRIFFMLDNVNPSYVTIISVYVLNLLQDFSMFVQWSALCSKNLKLMIMAQSTSNTTAPQIPLKLLGQRVEMRLRGNGLFDSGFPGCSTAISSICGFISIHRASQTQQPP